MTKEEQEVIINGQLYLVDWTGTISNFKYTYATYLQPAECSYNFDLTIDKVVILDNDDNAVEIAYGADIYEEIWNEIYSDAIDLTLENYEEE